MAMFSEALVEQSRDSACLKSVHRHKNKSTISSFVEQSFKILKHKSCVTPNTDIQLEVLIYIT